MPTQKKLDYEERVFALLERYDKALLIGCDNVGSKQMAEIRRTLRGSATLLMGKNTLMKKCIRAYSEKTGDGKWDSLIDLLVLNVGILFVDGSLPDIRKEVLSNTVPAAAKAGAIANRAVTIPAGNTGMDPSQTSFFQALNIPTKITKGSVEIIKDIELLKVGDKVESSAAALLAKLDIKPFEYCLQPLMVLDNGSVYDAKVLDITDDDLLASFKAGVNNVAAVSLATGIPTVASVPHSIINAYKNVLAIAIATEYSFPLADKVKDIDRKSVV